MKIFVILSLFTLNSLRTLPAAVPLRWTVETSRATPAQFEAYKGETLAIEASLQSYGKPLAAPSNYSLYWQTNGMGSTYWSVPCVTTASSPSNVLFATWSPTNDVGAKVYNCFIGQPGTIYHAAFQLRLLPSPGATPNELPLPQKVIDFAKVTVLNPPWSGGGGGGVDTNSVRKIVDGSFTGGTNAVNAAMSEIPNKLDVSPDRELYPNPMIFWSGSQLNINGSASIYHGLSVAAPVIATSFDPYSWEGYRANDEQLPAYLNSLSWRTTGNRTLAQYGITDGATKNEVNAAMTAANDANVWSSATFNFMTGGRTNCWFSGTNYVFGTDAAARTRFAWEDGMDAATVPCSMALWEIRDGVRQLVWDQRDWTAWYWSFKANQMQTNVTAQIAALGLAVTNDSNYAWAKRYASDGTPNPDASTTFIDTPSVTLSPGMKWETVATVSGAAYWTIVGDGAIIGGSGTNAVLRIQDFEGNDIMTVTKGEHRLAWIERGEITGQMYDGDGWVCFDMLADAEPIGYFSTTLDSSDFLPQTDPNCPAQYEWEDLHNGKYRIHYLLKPGIQSNACFAKFQVEVEGQTIIRYNAGQEISGGLIYNGVKIAPDISGSPAVGTVIQWKVVNR